MWSAVASEARHRFGSEYRAKSKAPSPLGSAGASHKKTAPSIEGDGTALMAVSPFDGANRIRFKGSPDCGFTIADCGTPGSSAFSIPKSTFRRDSQPHVL